MELKQYFKVIRKKMWLIALIVLIITVASAVKAFYFTTDYYQANAKLIVNQSSPLVDGYTVPNMQVVQANIMMINSYKEIIRSTAILKKVAENYPDLNIEASNISVASANNSQVMNLSYVDVSYERAAKVVNAISTVFKEEIPLIMKVDNVTILNGAYLNTNAAPINKSPLIAVILGFIVSLMLSLGLVFLLEYLDNTIKSEAELEEAIGLAMLTVVPKITKDDMLQRKQAAASKNKQAGEGKYATLN